MSTLQMQERGGCLTAWLLVMLLANGFTVISYLFGFTTMQQVYPTVHPVIFVLLAGLGIVNLASVYGLWTWKKWGFYLFAISASVVLVINLSIGIPILPALLGLVGIGLLWLLLRNR